MEKRMIFKTLLPIAICFLCITGNGFSQPDAPENVYVVPRYEATISLIIHWDDMSSDETGFEIERREEGGAGPITFNVGPGIEIYQDNTATADKMWEYRVRALGGAAGNSAWVPASNVSSPRIEWPMSDGSHNILHNYGNPLGSASNVNNIYFHDGVDVAGDGMHINTPRGGIVTYVYAGANGGVHIKVDCGAAGDYKDVLWHIQADAVVSENDVLAPGDDLGDLYDFVGYDPEANHTHFGTRLLNDTGKINSLSIYTQNNDRDPNTLSPVVADVNNDGEDFIVVNAADNDHNNPRDPAYDDVDFLVDVFDDMATAFDLVVSPHSIGYWIEPTLPGAEAVQSGATPYLLIAFNYTLCGASCSPEAVATAAMYAGLLADLHGINTWQSYYTWIVTNTSGTDGAEANVDENQFWRTNARSGTGTEPNGSDASIARVNQDAKFPDGTYHVHIVQQDQIHSSDDIRAVIVDNFLPYVKRVTIHSGPVLIYEARWEWDATRLVLDPPDPNAAIFGVADRTQDIAIEVEFSEPMKDTPTLDISPLGVSPTLTSTEPLNQRQIWTATVSAIDIDDGGADDGIHFLTIDGFDLSDNQLLEIYLADPINPIVSINRDASGNFPATTGSDALHRFQIGPVAGPQTILLLCMKHPLIPEPTETPADIASDIQTALNNYYSEVSWDRVTFAVNPAPSWMDLDNDPGDYYAVDMNPVIELVEEAIDEAVSQGVSFAGVNRLMVVTNENADRDDYATTSFWPYNVPGLGNQMISSSVHTMTSTDAHYTHAVGHHLGLVDLYAYPHVSTPRPFVGQWGHMADMDHQPHFISWSKHRLGWITDSGNIEERVEKPSVGSPITGQNHVISPIETDTDDTKTVIVEVADRLAYYIENRKNIGLDGSLTDSGVLITKVNEYVEPGAGPAIVEDPTDDGNLNDACYSNGETFTDANVNLTIDVLAPTGDNENIQISYDPPSDRNDVYITKQDGRYQTPDIWVDAPDALGFFNDTDPESEDDNPKVGVQNRVYCRVQNQGDAAATDFRIFLELRTPWTTGEDFTTMKEEFVALLPGVTGKQLVWTTWTPTSNTATCARVRIEDVANDDNYENNEAQENIHEFDSEGSSPYTPVITEFDIGNPYDEEILVYLRVDGLPEDWPINLTPKKVLLAPKANVRANVEITPLEIAPRCSREAITITAYTPRGNTLVPLGAITLNVHLVNHQNINQRTWVECKRIRDVKTTTHYPEAYEQCTIFTEACTDPPRPNETIYVVYESPSGEKTVREIMTDENGCFEDFFHVGEAGVWQVGTVLESDDCNGSAEPDPEFVIVGPDPFPRPKQIFISFHFGGSFPQGDFDKQYDDGFSLNVDTEFILTKNLSLDLIYGHHQFYNNVDNQFIKQYSLNAKYYVPWLGWRLFAHGGFGWYKPELASSEWGYNVGMGTNLHISNKLLLEILVNYHHMKGEENIDWLTAQMGILFRVF